MPVASLAFVDAVVLASAIMSPMLNPDPNQGIGRSCSPTTPRERVRSRARFPAQMRGGGVVEGCTSSRRWRSFWQSGVAWDELSKPVE